MINLENCVELDKNDSLKDFRDYFYLPTNTIYLDGNSLGPPSKNAFIRANELLEEWKNKLISGWFECGWMNLPLTLGAKISQIIGAEKDEVIVTDSTSINFFKLLSAALDINSDRKVLLTEQSNFPTDLHIADGLVKLKGNKHQIKIVDEGSIIDNLDYNIAVLFLTHVNYRTGQMHDMEKVTAAAHAKGILVIWDLSHSTGVIPLELNTNNVDFAVGCGYKYLNGGPGSPSFLFVAKKHQVHINPALSGWLGHSNPFNFESVYHPADGIQRFMVGTPSPLSLSILDANIDLILQTNLKEIRNKSLLLSDLFLTLIQQECKNSFKILTPLSHQFRGSQISLAHECAKQISESLIKKGIIIDFRPPNIIRFGFSPLYVRFIDIWDTVKVIKSILINEFSNNKGLDNNSLKSVYIENLNKLEQKSIEFRIRKNTEAINTLGFFSSNNITFDENEPLDISPTDTHNGHRQVN